MRKFTVMGMSCAACSARVEKAVSSLDGVTSCSVNLLTGQMTVEGNLPADIIIKAVTDAGYGAVEEGKTASNETAALSDTETAKLRKRLVWSLAFLAVLMYFSMGHTMAGLPLSPFFENSSVAVGLAQMVTAAVIAVINNRFFVSGTKALIHRAPNMDTLVSLGAAAAFIYSTALLFSAAVQPEKADEILHGLYFESSGMILTLITVGKLLEAKAKGKTTDAIRSLLDLSPKTATLVRDGEEITVPVGEVSVGDVFAVRPGENFPVDGVVTEGESAADESSLTGESIPCDKSVGDRVFAGSVNLSGYVRCRAAGVGADTALAGIVRAVSEASATKAPVQKIADKVSGIFVPAVLGIAAVTVAVWLIINGDVGHALSRGISVLVISCPCSLGLATPVAIMVGSGIGAKNGIFYKTAAALENAGKADIAVLDKTGTVTEGKPNVTDVIPAGGTDDNELVTLAASVEHYSEHPLSCAIVAYAEKSGTDFIDATDFKAHPGSGVSATVSGKTVFGGKLKFIEKYAKVSEESLRMGEKLSCEGKTPLYFASNGAFLGIIAVADILKPDAKSAVLQLKNMGMRVVMLTGDNKLCAEAVAKNAGIDEVISEVLPEEKDNVIKELRKAGKVIMVGDGINDAPALTRADTGIAIGAGVDIAIDSADAVLMNSHPEDIPAAVRLSRRTFRNIKENLFWAFFYNSLGIPLAAGAFTALLGWELSPMIAATAMSLSSFSVVMNALRLNLFDIRSTSHDKVKHKSKKEIKAMEKTMRIEGMMCPHCEARVKKCLESIEGVVSAEVSHEAGTATVTLSENASDSVLKGAVEAEGYTVLSII